MCPGFIKSTPVESTSPVIHRLRRRVEVACLCEQSLFRLISCLLYGSKWLAYVKGVQSGVCNTGLASTSKINLARNANYCMSNYFCAFSMALVGMW